MDSRQLWYEGWNCVTFRGRASFTLEIAVKCGRDGTNIRPVNDCLARPCHMLSCVNGEGLYGLYAKDICSYKYLLTISF